MSPKLAVIPLDRLDRLENMLTKEMDDEECARSIVCVMNALKMNAYQILATPWPMLGTDETTPLGDLLGTPAQERMRTWLLQAIYEKRKELYHSNGNGKLHKRIA